MAKKSELTKTEEKLWKITRKIVFRDHGTNCYTCAQRNLEGANCQCGHGFPKGALGAKMKYDLRILRPQCFNCNINHGGMGVVFWKSLEREMGKRKADKLYLECQGSKGNTTKALPYYQELIKQYTALYENS